jgi:NAD(P)-dependent dehydrogenase (short-subunit alcohol dehydrogenase family)
MSTRNVLITGASTGIGRACALRLDARGWNVFAGVRKQDDAGALQAAASPRLRPVILDVTDAAGIEAAREEIESHGATALAGLVNNAGVTVQGPLEFLEPDELRRQLDVNVVGQLVVTQTFMGAIRAGQGRIVFMSSIAGRTPSLPFVGPYSASKKALEGMAEALRLELSPWDISVSLIEPGSIDTPIWSKGDDTFEQQLSEMPPEAIERYRPWMDRARKIAAATGKRGIAADKVAEKVEHALASPRPRARYLVGLDALARAYLEPALPTRWRDKLVTKVMGPGGR